MSPELGRAAFRLAMLVVAYWPSNFSLHRAIAVAHAKHTERSTGAETEMHLGVPYTTCGSSRRRVRTTPGASR